MIIRIKAITKRKKIIPNLIIFILYSILIHLSLIYYKDILYEYSLDLTSQINKDETILEYMPYLQKASEICGNFRTHVIITLVVYNYANIFKVFILISALSLGNLMGGILKIIYHEPLMYYSNYSKNEFGTITPLSCSCGWGLPSLYSVSSTCVYLTLWKIVIDNRRIRYNPIIKIALFILAFLIILFVNFCKFMAALHSLDQIIFGILVGIQIFFFLFYVLGIDLNDGKWLVKIVTINFAYVIIINSFILAGTLLIYFFFGPDEKSLQQLNNNIDQSKCGYFHSNLRFNNESLFLFSFFFCNIALILAMKCELQCLFSNNDQNWRQYNFAKENGDDDSFYSKLSISRETQWNHTTFFISFLRLIAIFCFHFIISIPFLLIPYNENLVLVLFGKIFLPMNISVFFMFHVEKLLLKRLSLINDSIFQLMSETF